MLGLPHWAVAASGGYTKLPLLDSHCGEQSVTGASNISSGSPTGSWNAPVGSDGDGKNPSDLGASFGPVKLKDFRGFSFQLA